MILGFSRDIVESAEGGEGRKREINILGNRTLRRKIKALKEEEEEGAISF